MILKISAETAKILEILAAASKMTLEEYVKWILDKSIKDKELFQNP